MPVSHDITSAANPRIKSAVKLRRSRERRKSGRFLAEGPREVGRAVGAGLDVIEVFHCPELSDAAAVSDALCNIQEQTPVYTVPDGLLKMMAYRDEPEGILAVVRQPLWTLDNLPAVENNDLFLVAVGTAKPGNLGAMARSAEAAGCKAMLACGTPVDVFNPNAIRASTCAVYTMPIVNADHDQAIVFLRQQGIRIAATTPNAERSVLYTDADLTGKLALVIGPEDTGLDEAWLNAADLCLSIPTLGQTVDSLNAANAAAVLLFEAVRQRSNSV